LLLTNPRLEPARKESRTLFEGCEFAIFAQRLVDVNALSLEIFVDRPGETLVADVVRRKGRDRAIAPRQFMFALRAGLDAG
jgi:hypothetical protein